MNSKIHVAIKSYGRAGKVTTLDLMPFAKIWVPKFQANGYRKYYGETVVEIPDDEDGNVARKANAILNRSPCPWTLIVDDDLKNIGFYEDNKEFILTPTDIKVFIEHGFALANELGVRLWGMNQNQDPLGHYTYRPFNLLAPILAPFSGHLKPSLRYDERIPYKEDYDFWLQNIRKHRKTLRINKYHYRHRHGLGKGGLAGMRTMRRERECVERMTQKWGTKVFRSGGSAGGRSATGKNILNCIVKVPIPGC